MKKILFPLLVVLLSFNSGISQEQVGTTEIKWMTWDEMVAAQGTERKKVFIDVYTDWCGWCKRMDASTFLDPAIVDYMNKNYYAVKFDAEMSKQIEWNGMTFVNPRPGVRKSTHQFAASLLDSKLSYPSFVLLDENFNRIHILKGFQQPEPLIGNLIFFNSNQHIRYNQYMQQQQKAQQTRQQQEAQQTSN